MRGGHRVARGRQETARLGGEYADAAGKRLYIADSTHHRVAVTDLDGNKIAVIGTGQPGCKDGASYTAQCADHQGQAPKRGLLYSADPTNPAARAICP